MRAKPFTMGLCCFSIDLIAHPRSPGLLSGELDQYSFSTTHFLYFKLDVYVIFLWWKKKVHDINIFPLIVPLLCFYSNTREGHHASHSSGPSPVIAGTICSSCPIGTYVSSQFGTLLALFLSFFFFFCNIILKKSLLGAKCL